MAGRRRLLTASAADADNLDVIFGNGDTLTVAFDVATDRADAAADATVDAAALLAILRFEPALTLGTNGMEGAWTDDKTLVITFTK